MIYCIFRIQRFTFFSPKVGGNVSASSKAKATTVGGAFHLLCGLALAHVLPRGGRRRTVSAGNWASQSEKSVLPLPPPSPSLWHSLRQQTNCLAVPGVLCLPLPNSATHCTASQSSLLQAAQPPTCMIFCWHWTKSKAFPFWSCYGRLEDSIFFFNPGLLIQNGQMWSLLRTFWMFLIRSHERQTNHIQW